MRRLPRILEKEQVEKLLKALPDRERLMAELIYRTGLRASEVISLRPEDFNRDLTAVRVNNGKGGKDRIAVIAQNEDFKARLREQIRRAKNFLFESRTGNKINTSRLRTALAIAGKKAGIPFRVHPHTLRHTHATLLLENGVNLETVREQLGHASLSTTQVYLHLSLTKRKEEIGKVEL